MNPIPGGGDGTGHYTASNGNLFLVMLCAAFAVFGLVLLLAGQLSVPPVRRGLAEAARWEWRYGQAQETAGRLSAENAHLRAVNAEQVSLIERLQADLTEMRKVQLYVHNLEDRAADVIGVDREHLVSTVAVARCESTHNEAAVSNHDGIGVLGYLQLAWDSAMERTAGELGYTKADMLSAGPNIRVAERWREKTDRGTPWRLWGCRP